MSTSNEEGPPSHALFPDSWQNAVSQSISRRRVVGSGLAMVGGGMAISLASTADAMPHNSAIGVAAPATRKASTDHSPSHGDVPPNLTQLDQTMLDLLTTWELPGAQLAVGYGGRLVLERSYGFADVELAEPMLPDHLIRIASVSKTFTAVTVLRLIEDGSLSLDTAVYPLLGLTAARGAVIDPRVETITVENLLVHAGGFDAGVSGDPQYLPLSQVAASVFGDPGPASAETIARFMLGVPLDHAPGSQSIYSNFGFNLLGRVIEHVTGQPYEDAVQSRVLTPAGITAIKQGRTRLTERAEGEVRYYEPLDFPPALPSVFPGEGFVSSAYGSFYMEGMDSHGGWLSTAADLVRYALSIDGTRGPALLGDAIVELMLSAPRPPVPDGAGGLTDNPVSGLGWFVRDTSLGRTWEHNGALTGSNASLLSRTDDGITIAFIANSLPLDIAGFFGDVEDTLLRSLAEVSVWPDLDLFSAP